MNSSRHLLIGVVVVLMVVAGCQSNQPVQTGFSDKPLRPPGGSPCDGEWPENPNTLIECCGLEIPNGLELGSGLKIYYAPQNLIPCDETCAKYDHPEFHVPTDNIDCTRDHEITVYRYNCDDEDACSALAHELTHMEQSIRHNCWLYYRKCSAHSEVGAHARGCQHNLETGSTEKVGCELLADYCQKIREEPEWCGRKYPEAASICACGGGYDHIATPVTEPCWGLCPGEDERTHVCEMVGSSCQCRETSITCEEGRSLCASDRQWAEGVYCCDNETEKCCKGSGHTTANNGPVCCGKMETCCGVDEYGRNLCCPGQCTSWENQDGFWVSKCCEIDKPVACGEYCCPDCHSCCPAGREGCCNKEIYGARPTCCSHGCCKQEEFCCTKEDQPEVGSCCPDEKCDTTTGQCGCPEDRPVECAHTCCPEDLVCSDDGRSCECPADQVTCYDGLDISRCCDGETPICCEHTCCEFGQECSDNGSECIEPDGGIDGDSGDGGDLSPDGGGGGDESTDPDPDGGTDGGDQSPDDDLDGSTSSG